MSHATLASVEKQVALPLSCKFPAAAAATPPLSKPVPAAKMDGPPPAAGLGASAALLLLPLPDR